VFRRVPKGIHPRGEALHAENDNSSKPSKRARANTNPGPSNIVNGSSPAQNDPERLRSIAVEDGEALESAIADSQLLPPQSDSTSSRSWPQKGAIATDASLGPGIESFDAEIFEAELSSLHQASRKQAEPQQSPTKLPHINPRSPRTSPRASGAIKLSSASYDSSAPAASASLPRRRSNSSASSSSGASTGSNRPAYRPRSALSLARRRMLIKYLPFQWQQVQTAAHVSSREHLLCHSHLSVGYMKHFSYSHGF
jgi:hypothetical protein